MDRIEIQPPRVLTTWGPRYRRTIRRAQRGGAGSVGGRLTMRWVARLDCRAPEAGPVHSTDRVTIVGGSTTLRVCGFHASWGERLWQHLRNRKAAIRIIGEVFGTAQ